MTQFKKGSRYPFQIGGFLVPKEFIVGLSLGTLEKILGFRTMDFEQDDYCKGH